MLHKRAPSVAFIHAQLERARPAQLLSFEREGHSTPQVHCTLQLINLLSVVAKIGASQGNAFKVKQSLTGPVLQITALGRQLLDCLPALALGLSASTELRFDPRIAVAVDAARNQGLCPSSVQTFREALYIDPWSASSRLNGVVDQIRHVVNRRAFMHAMQRRRAKHSENLKDVLTYFKRVAALNPDSSVMRLELRAHPLARAQWQFPHSGVASLHDTFHTWLGQVQSTYGEIIVANAWKIDFDGTEGFFVHIALAFAGPGTVGLQAVERDLGETWRSIAGGTSYILNCKGEAMELEYRGGRPATWNFSLNDELHDVAVFLAGTDSLLAWDLDGKPPTHGRGRMPEKGALQPGGRQRATVSCGMKHR